MKEKIKKLVNSRTVIHIKTLEQLKELDNVVAKLNIRPILGDKSHEIKTGNFCVRINNYGCMWGYRDYYNDKGYNIIEFEDLLKNKCIVIYQKENEVIALDKRTGKKAVAKCNPRDTFDFDIGAKLALERLTKKVTFRALCIESDDNIGNSYFTKGKVYEFVNGVTTWDPGFNSCKYLSYEDFTERNRTWESKFVELKDGDNPEEILKRHSLLNTKICITEVTDPNEYFTVGRIYEIRDGFIVADDGVSYPRCKPLRGIENARAYFSGDRRKRDKVYCSFEPIKFVEVVE